MTGSTSSEQGATPASIEAEVAGYVATVRDVEGRCKAAFLPHLRDHGITRAEIHYDGGGDEGSVGDVFAFAGEAAIDLPDIQCDHFALEYSGAVSSHIMRLEDALAAFAENAVCTHHCGWENGEGAHGIIAIDVASGAVSMTHNIRFIDYETSETEL